MKPPVSVKVQNVQSVNKAISKYGITLANKIDRLVQGVAMNTITDVKKRIQSPPKTGKIYKRGNISHQASAPGQAPATDTGTLASSIYYKKTRLMTAMIGSRLPYAYYLEFGTLVDGTTRIEKRPSWAPAVEIAKETLSKKIAKAIEKEEAK